MIFINCPIYTTYFKGVCFVEGATVVDKWLLRPFSRNAVLKKAVAAMQTFLELQTITSNCGRAG